MCFPFVHASDQLLRLSRTGEIGRTPLELLALLLLALPLLLTLQALVAEFTERNHQLARISKAHPPTFRLFFGELYAKRHDNGA